MGTSTRKMPDSRTLITTCPPLCSANGSRDLLMTPTLKNTKRRLLDTVNQMSTIVTKNATKCAKKNSTKSSARNSSNVRLSSNKANAATVYATERTHTQRQ